MKLFVILAVVGIATAQLAHHRPIQIQLHEHNPAVNHRPIQIQTPPIEFVPRQPNFDESQQPGQVAPNFPTWNWQNEMPVRRFPEIFEIVDQPQPPFAFPMPIKPEQTFPWNGQLPVEQEPGSPRWENWPQWGQQMPEQLPEVEQPQWNAPRWRPQPEQLPEVEQPQWNAPRWRPQPEPEPEPEQPQWNIPRWNQRPQPQPQPLPEPEPEWNAPRWQPRVPEPDQHIPRLPPWAMPQPEPEPEPEVPRWGNNPRWNQWQQPQFPQFPLFPQLPQLPEPEPEPLPPRNPIMRPSPPEPELISPPVERPIRPNFPQQPPIRHPVAPRASWRDGLPDARCPVPDDHEGYPIFLPGNTQWSFFICWGGIAWPFDCPEDTVFRPEVNVCADRAWNPVQMQPYFTQEDEVAVPYEAVAEEA